MIDHYFDLEGECRRLWPHEMRWKLGIRSPRTLDAYLKLPGFPRGKLEHAGRLQVRTWSASELGLAQAWLAARRLPGTRAGHLRTSNFSRARTGRAEVLDLLVLAGRLLREAGAEALADALRPLGFAAPGFDKFSTGARAAARAAIIRKAKQEGVSI